MECGVAESTLLINVKVGLLARPGKRLAPARSFDAPPRRAFTEAHSPHALTLRSIRHSIRHSTRRPKLRATLPTSSLGHERPHCVGSRAARGRLSASLAGHDAQAAAVVGGLGQCEAAPGGRRHRQRRAGTEAQRARARAQAVRRGAGRAVAEPDDGRPEAADGD